MAEFDQISSMAMQGLAIAIAETLDTLHPEAKASRTLYDRLEAITHHLEGGKSQDALAAASMLKVVCREVFQVVHRAENNLPPIAE